jgi:hypothetical protein
MITVIYDESSKDTTCRFAELSASEEKMLDDEVDQLNRKTGSCLTGSEPEMANSSLVVEAGSLLQVEAQQSVVKVR